MTLRIETKKTYKGTGQLTNWYDNERHGFESTVNTALGQIRSTEVGSSLLRAIERAGQEVLIVRVAQNVGNNCVVASATQPNFDAACYKEVLNDSELGKKIQELIASNTIQEGHPANKKYLKFHGRQTAYQTTVGQYTVPQAHKPKGDRSHSLDEALKLKASEGQQIDALTNLVGYLQNGLVSYHIMDYLTPGAGTGAWVLWDPLLESVFKNLPTEKRAAWMDRPPWLALAHELIHGWRLASGRCVFRPNARQDVDEYYYEEAMTVGLPPYDQCRFTENRLRQFKGLPFRTFYGEATRTQSTHAEAKHGSVVRGLKFSIQVVGGGPNDPLVFDYDIRSAGKPGEIKSGRTDSKGSATAQWMIDGEIRFSGFGALGSVETQWQKILISRYMTLQFGRYRFICEPL